MLLEVQVTQRDRSHFQRIITFDTHWLRITRGAPQLSIFHVYEINNVFSKQNLKSKILTSEEIFIKTNKNCAFVIQTQSNFQCASRRRITRKSLIYKDSYFQTKNMFS